MDGTADAYPGARGASGVSERTQKLRSLGLDGAVPDEAFDRFAHLAASLAKAPIAMVNFINDERQMFRGLVVPPGAAGGTAHGPADRAVTFELPTREMPLSHGYCPHVLAQRAPLALDDVFAYPRFSGNPVVEELGVRSYLGAPLVDDEGVVLGTVCVIDREPRRWGRDQMRDMQHLAQALLAEIRLRDSLVRQQEEMLAAFDGSPFPVLLTEGPDHRVRYTNAEHDAVFGRPAPQADGPRALPQLAAVGVFDAASEAFRTGEPVVVESVRVRTGRDGRGEGVVTVSCTPLHLAHRGSVDGVLVVAVPAQTRTDEDLDRLAALLVQRLQRHGQVGTLPAAPPPAHPAG